MDWALVAAGLFPAIVLCSYIYRKDRVEKEPLGLLLKLLLSGVVICYPVVVAEEFLLELFAGNAILENFVGIALAEEGFKLLALFLITKKSREFDSLFDGIIYATFVSLGFAAFENVLYVIQYGWATALTRAVTSVPAHTFFGVFMGYYYSLLNIMDKAAIKERKLKEEGLVSKSVPEFSGKKYAVLSLIVPTFAHGLYDYCCTSDSWLAMLVFFAFLIGMYIYCFGKVKKMSVKDAPVSSYVFSLLAKKYPELESHIYIM